MAVDMFLKLDGIKGEATDKTHKDDIDVLAWSWGVANAHGAVGKGGGAGKANFQDLSFTKYVDKASSQLHMSCATGKHIAKGELFVRKAGGEQLEYIKITLTDCLISSVSTGGSGGEERLTENVTLSYSKFEFGYQPQNAKGGKEGGEMKWGYDLKLNQKV